MCICHPVLSKPLPRSCSVFFKVHMIFYINTHRVWDSQNSFLIDSNPLAKSWSIVPTYKIPQEYITLLAFNYFHNSDNEPLITVFNIQNNISPSLDDRHFPICF